MAISNILKKLNHRDTKFLPRFSKISKVIIFSILAISTVFFVKNIFAADSLIKQKQDAIKTGNNQESWMYESIGSNAVSGIVAISGEIPDSVLDGTQTTGWIPSGMFGQTANLISSTFNQPASGVQYIAQIKDNFLGKSTYAADGIGYNGLSPLLSIWKTFRNAIYALFSVVFIVIGIMIMLRVKISPQAVISIQNSIPKIISSLILVTFSYAIVGLLIDLSYFVQAFVIGLLFQGTGITNTASDLFTQNNGIFGGISKVFSEVFKGTVLVSNLNTNNLANLTNMDMTRSLSLISQFTPFWVASAIGAIIGVVAGTIIGAIFSAGIGAPVGALAGLGLGAAIFTLIFEIIMLILIIKFFVGLIKCYFSLIIKIIMGPLEIAMGAFPNSKIGFNSWIINIIGNLAVFPICVIYIVLVTLILNQLTKVGFMWTPTLLSIGGLQATPISAIKMIFGLGALFMLPKLPTMIPEFIFQIKPSPWGKALGESFAPFSKTATGIGKGGLSVANEKVDEKLGKTGGNKNVIGYGADIARSFLNHK